jgi:hypothetical protein
MAGNRRYRMKVKSIFIEKEKAQVEIQELYKHSIQTGCGVLTFALVKIYGWCIVEYTTGLAVLHDIGKLSKSQFIKITEFIAKLNPEKIKENIEKNERIN